MRVLSSKLKAASARLTDDVAVAFALGFAAAAAFVMVIDVIPPAAKTYEPPFATSNFDVPIVEASQ